jgi:hypothetical protein
MIEIKDLILRSALSRVSKDGLRASWFETALPRLLTMRVSGAAA